MKKTWWAVVCGGNVEKKRGGEGRRSRRMKQKRKEKHEQSINQKRTWRRVERYNGYIKDQRAELFNMHLCGTGAVHALLHYNYMCGAAKRSLG